MSCIDIYIDDDTKYQTIYPSQYDKYLNDLIKYIPVKQHPLFPNKEDVEHITCSTEVYVTSTVVLLDRKKNQVDLYRNIHDFHKLYVVFNYDYWHYHEWKEIKLKQVDENASIEVCRRAIKEDPFSIVLMRDKPEELCRLAIKHNWRVFEHIPEIKYNKKMHIFAVECNGKTLKHIPHNMRTKYLCFAAVKQHALLLEYVPDRVKFGYICREAVQKNGFALQYVPPSLYECEYTDICILALEYDGCVLKFIPIKRRSKHIYERAITSSYKSFQFITGNEQTEELCEFALHISVEVLKWFSDTMKTPKMLALAVTLNGCALEYIHHNMITTELCNIAVKSNGLSLKHVPPARITYEMCANAVENNPDALQYVPLNMKTYDLCVTAYNKKSYVIIHIPQNIKNLFLRRSRL